MTNKCVENLSQSQQPRLTVDESHHVDTKHVLHLCLCIQIVEHYIAHLATTQLDYDAHTVFVGLIPQLGNALDLLFFNQFGNLLNKPRFVHLIRDFRHDDSLLTTLLIGQHFGAGAHVNTAAPGLVCLQDSGFAVDDSRGWEIGPRDMLHEPFDTNIWIVQQRYRSAYDLSEIVRGDIGCHAHRDPARAIDQEIRNLSRQHIGYLLGAVVVVREVDGFLVQICQQIMGDLRHTNLGITHRRRRVAVYRAKVALTINEGVTQRKILRHADNCIVDRGVSMGMILTDHITHDTGRFFVRLVVVVRQHIHGEQYPPVHRFQTVTNIGQSAPHDHTHGIGEIGLAHFAL